MNEIELIDEDQEIISIIEEDIDISTPTFQGGALFGIISIISLSVGVVISILKRST